MKYYYMLKKIIENKNKEFNFFLTFSVYKNKIKNYIIIDII